MYRYVIFDMDGTILDTLEDIADATNWVCQQHGWPGHPVEAFKQFVGNGASKLLERVVPSEVEVTHDLQVQLTNEFTDRYTGQGARKTQAYRGMPQALERLKAAGITTAVLTNKPDVAVPPLVARYYPGVFSHTQGALLDVPTKPDPTLLRRLMGRMGAVPEETLFVGDSNVDIQTAKNGGLASCGVLWGFRTREELEAEGADYIVETPEELAHLILG